MELHTCSPVSVVATLATAQTDRAATKDSPQWATFTVLITRRRSTRAMTTDQVSTSSLATEPADVPADIRQSLDRGQALLVTTLQAGSAAGIAEYAIRRARRAGRSAFYASPNEALALRRYRQWQAALGPDEVGLLTKSARHQPETPLVVGYPGNAALNALYRSRPAPSRRLRHLRRYRPPDRSRARDGLGRADNPAAHGTPAPLPIGPGGQRRRVGGVADAGPRLDAPAASRSAGRALGAPLPLGQSAASAGGHGRRGRSRGTAGRRRIAAV